PRARAPRAARPRARPAAPGRRRRGARPCRRSRRGARRGGGPGDASSSRARGLTAACARRGSLRAGGPAEKEATRRRPRDKERNQRVWYASAAGNRVMEAQPWRRPMAPRRNGTADTRAALGPVPPMTDEASEASPRRAHVILFLPRAAAEPEILNKGGRADTLYYT
ncbi:hypothetical protein PVAP13_3KG297527, partial [Panicum virgatum]